MDSRPNDRPGVGGLDPVLVTTAAESAARDSAAIAAGIPSRALMRQAGAAAATEIDRRYHERLSRGVLVLAGPGNNGGDAWVVAAALAARGCRVAVEEVGEPRTDDARAEREHARAALPGHAASGGESLVVDGLLGTGASGPPRGAIADGISRIARLREAGAAVVALDVPSGLDATTGAADGAVAADLTLTFGTVKRGHLVARDRCGRVVVLDIGLGAHARGDGDAPSLLDARRVAARVPPIPFDAHKGTRGRVAIVGGARGMAGAVVLAARAAARSGAGLPRLVVDEGSVPIAQVAAPAALADAWPADDEQARRLLEGWAHAVLVGPGLGRARAREMTTRVLGAWRGPTALDADALNAFEGDVGALAALLDGRPAVITPHPLELARLAGVTLERVLAERFDIGRELAARLGAVVLLKGVPTVVTAPDGRRLVSAAGAPSLAVGGSGDVLAGIVVTLLAQMDDPLEAAACAAWVHGRAGELAASGGGGARGTSLDDVIDALPGAWGDTCGDVRYPALAELPAPSSASGRAG